MTEKDTEHVYIDQMVGPVANGAGVPKTVARRVIRSFCKELNRELSAGHDVTLRDVGRFKVSENL
jgi:nucleoid DNA-binding protein